MQLTHPGLVELETSEGFSSAPYLDDVASPPVWTQGFGETEGITKHSPRITRAQGEQRLIRRFNSRYAPALEPFIGLPGFNNERYNGLGSFIWNCGVGAVGPQTTVGRLLRQAKWDEAADAMLAWCRNGAGEIIPGLYDRRRREAKMVKTNATPMEGYTPYERRLIHEHDHLERTNPHSPRLAQLATLMTEQRKRIWRVSQPADRGGDGSGWLVHHRRERYRSLAARTMR